MERNTFLKLCQEVSKLPEGLNYMRKYVPDQLRVVHKGIEYYPYAFYFLFRDGNVSNIAVLHDLKTNSFISVPVDEVSAK